MRGAWPLLLTVISCGTLGGEDGGAENLPNRGIAPYVPVSLESLETVTDFVFPPALLPGQVAVRSPSMVVYGQTISMFALVVAGGDPPLLGRADSPDGIVFGPFVDVVPGLRPDASASPTVAIDESGLWHLVFGDASGSVLWHAVSDDGRSFIPDGVPLLVADPDEAGGISSPSLVFADGVAHIYYQARSAMGLPASIKHTAGPTFQSRVSILDSGAGCKDLKGQPTACFDGSGVLEPEVRIAVTATGRRVFRLFYVGLRGEVRTLAFAAAHLADTPFERYAYNPVLEVSGRKLAEPTNVRFGARYLLYTGTTALRGGVALSINETGIASESF